MALVIVMDGVYLRAGRQQQAFPIVGQLKPPAPWERLAQFGLMLHWDRSHDWLQLSARVIGGSVAIPFATDLAGLDDICQKHDVPRDRLAPPAFLEAQKFLVASLPSANQIELQVEIDTDAPQFRTMVEQHRDPMNQNVVFPVSLIYFDQKQFKQYVQKSSQIHLAFKPCKPLPKFNGAVAIDLGNTVSTVAALAEASKVYETEAIQIVPVDPQTDQPTLLTSALRLDEVRTPPGAGYSGTRRLPSLPSDDFSQAVRWAAGRAAIAGSSSALEGVIVGVKQWLSVPVADSNGTDTNARPQYFPLNILHRVGETGAPQIEPMEIHNHFPGELLLTQLISRFRAVAKAWPADLVLTYPTTYTRAELKYLVTAASRAWLRAMQQPQQLDATPEPTGDLELDRLINDVRGWLANPGRMTQDCPVVRLALDEATAAGFFHIHKRIFEKPGALPRFRYIQPHGTHALVIDCGGGTTDVVLIHAKGESKKHLKLEILARTGLRGFGGDHITREVCRLVKAKMTLLTLRVVNPQSVPTTGLQLPATGPSDLQQARAAVEKFLAAVAGLPKLGTREALPTRLDRHSLSAETAAARAAFQALWRLGDDIKRKLIDSKPVKLNQLSKEHLQKETSALLRATFEGLTTQQQTQLIQQFGDIAILPWEVDALVHRTIESLIKKCNNLIAKKLRPLPHGGMPEVDWVVLSGNGARYPLVQTLCKQKLHVAFLDSPDSERFTFDQENLKHCVAKGAVMARMMSRVARTATVEYPPNLSERLPFDVGRQELDTGFKPPVFREFTMYADLIQQPAKLMMESARPGEPQTVVLERLFPGDETWSEFASYHFPNGVGVEVEATYDNESNRFRLTSQGEEAEYTDLTDPLEQVSPQNRGDC